MNIIGHGVAQGGTYNNNKCGVAAAYATLDVLQTQPIMETIERRGNYLMKGIKQIFDDASIPAHMSGYPAMFSFSIGEKKPTNQREWNKNDRKLYLEIIEACIEQGVMPDPDPREPWFLCYSHSDEDMDETLNIFADVVKNVKNKAK
jgi:glutamate-1-semialdehyde 2,1-aminomutase